MSVQELIQGKGTIVSVVPSHVTIDDVINQLEADEVSAIVVSDDNKNVLGIISGVDIVRGLKTFGRNSAHVRRGCPGQTRPFSRR